MTQAVPPKPVSEFQAIDQFFKPLASPLKESLNLIDDGAFIPPAMTSRQIIVKDMMVEGTHFLPDTDPALLAAKLLRTNYSDLAAMAAQPVAVLFGLALPVDWSQMQRVSWLKGFAHGCQADFNEFGGALLGGDTTSINGPLILSCTAIGQLQMDHALTRSSAQIGDQIYVTGHLGDAGLGLALLQQRFQTEISEEDYDYLTRRYHLPTPRLKEISCLASYCRGAMDLSDGLGGDLDHICQASHVGADIWLDHLPQSPAFNRATAHLGQNWTDRLHHKQALYPISAGDDYELCLIISQDQESQFREMAASANISVTYIGKIVEEPGIKFYLEPKIQLSAQDYPLLKSLGWQHF